jgi:mannose-1-phosphate guanylyltransferase
MATARPTATRSRALVLTVSRCRANRLHWKSGGPVDFGGIRSGARQITAWPVLWVPDGWHTFGLRRGEWSRKMNDAPWAVLLAGGSGTRLLPLTRRLCGDDRPKQFAPLLHDRTLLSLTRERLASIVPADKTWFSVVESQHRYYATELIDVDSSRVVVQPTNRGTSVAIVYCLLRIMRLDPDAVVAFFPTDHHYCDATAFAETLKNACDLILRHRQSVILIGAWPEDADEDYGWIEPGSQVQRTPTSALFNVTRFWEKPPQALAAELHRAGCLLNTFVMIGRASTFIELCHSAVPGLLRAFAPLAANASDEPKTARRIYTKISPGDFSHEVLARCTDRLLVLPLAGQGWSDLGTEERIKAVWAREGLVRVAGQSAVPGGEPHSLEAFHAWLKAYRKRLDDLCEIPAARVSGSGSSQ